MRDIQAEVSRAPAADVPWNGVVPPSHRTIRGCQRRAFRRRHAHPTRSGVVDASYAMVPMGPWAHHRALCQNQGDGIRSGVERAARPCEDLPWLGRSAAQLHGTSMLRRRRDHTEPRRGGGGGFAYACRGWRSIFVQDQHEKRPNAAACRAGCVRSRAAPILPGRADGIQYGARRPRATDQDGRTAATPVLRRERHKEGRPQPRQSIWTRSRRVPPSARLDAVRKKDEGPQDVWLG